MPTLPLKAVRVRTSDGWQDIALSGPAGPAGPGVPVGGSTGQVLTKTSSTDYATDWETPTTGGGGTPSGTAGGVLDGSYPNPGLNAAVAGNGLTETADVLSVNVDGTTLAITGDAVKVNTDGNAGHYLSGAGTWTTPAGTGGSTPAADTAVWMPLYDSDGSIVLDTDEGLIPTLIPIG